MQNQKQPYRYYSSYSSVRPVAVAAVAVPNRRLQILPVVIAALIIFGVSLALRTLHHPARAEVKAAATQAVSSLPSIPPVDEAALAAQINRIIASHPTLDMAISLNDVTNGKQYNYGLSDAGFIAASTGKIVTASLFLHQVEQGQESLTASLNGKSSQEELRLMIEESDNDAWAALNHELTHGSLLSYARSLGLKSYDPETNLISPADLSSFLGQLYQQ
jgi:beta-lactamase class A